MVSNGKSIAESEAWQDSDCGSCADATSLFCKHNCLTKSDFSKPAGVFLKTELTVTKLMTASLVSICMPILHCLCKQVLAQCG